MHPDFLIIGPPKCASTSLHYYLGQHPDVYTSKVKETRFFDLHYSKGLDYYEKFFKEYDNKKAVGEATPVYCFLPFVADRIKKDYPEMKMIVCFRNPLDRAFSGWLMQTGMGVEANTFREAIDINLKQLGYITFEGDEGAKIWEDSNFNITVSEARPRSYIQGSLYATMLENYFKRFDAKQIKIIFLDDLKSDFDKTMSDLFAFLNVNPDFKIPNKEVVNFHFDRKARRLLSKIIGIKGARFIAQNLPKSLKNPFKKAMRTKTKKLPVLSSEDRLYLWNIVKDDVADLAKITGRDLSNWNPQKKIK